MTPNWVGNFVRLLQKASNLPDLHLQVEAVTTLGIDPLGRPVGLNSLATLGYTLPGHEAPSESFNIRMDGVVDGNSLNLTVRSGDIVQTVKTFLPTDSLMGTPFRRKDVCRTCASGKVGPCRSTVPSGRPEPDGNPAR